MQLLGWLIRIAFFGLVLWFALKNTTPVPVRFGASLGWDGVPLIVVILACLLVGMLAGAAALAPRVFRLRRQVGQLQQQLRRASGAPDASAERLNDRLAAAAREGGAVGQVDSETRPQR